MNFICNPIHCLLDTFTGGGPPPGLGWIQNATEMTFLGLIYLQFFTVKDEALLCAGRCQQWLHHYCASVTEQQYKILCESNTPFLCPSCYQEQHEWEVKELMGNVETLKADEGLRSKVV